MEAAEPEATVDGVVSKHPVRSPSDLSRLGSGLGSSREFVAIGGRVAEIEGRRAVLADAFTSIPVYFSAPPTLSVGDLCIARGNLELFELMAAELIWSRRSESRPRVTSETDRFRDGSVGAALAARSQAVRAIRQYFHQEHFLEVDTPSIVPSPGLDLHLDAFGVVPTDKRSNTESGAQYLITSPEYQMKRLLVGGLPRCFQIGHAFRAAEVGAHHNPEFSMLEWYRTFATSQMVMADTEQVVIAAAEALFGSTVVPLNGEPVDLSETFDTITVTEAFQKFASIGESQMLQWAATDEDAFFRTWVDDVEPRLSAQPRPIFITRFPTPMASLARCFEDDPRYADRFELYLGGLELCNGFGELTDAAEQRARFKKDLQRRWSQSRPVYPIDERFVRALDEGMPPSAGNALGLDRLLAALLGIERIADVTAFPIGHL